MAKIILLVMTTIAFFTFLGFGMYFFVSDEEDKGVFCFILVFILYILVLGI